MSPTAAKDHAPDLIDRMAAAQQPADLTVASPTADGMAHPLGGADPALYTRTLQEVAASGAIADPKADMEHAHALLARLTPTELLQATFILEDFVEQTPAVKESLQTLSREFAGKTVPMQEALAEYGLTMTEDGILEARSSSDQAA